MFSINHIGRDGLDEPWPAGRVYAEALARYAGYTSSGAGNGGDRWDWLGPTVAGALYDSSAHGTPVQAKLYEPQRMLSLFFMEPNADGITCRMLGEPWDDDTLMALIAHLRPLPYAHLVGHALIAQADWLDEHPAYRGLRIAQSATRKVHVDDLGPEPAVFAGRARV